MSSTTDRSAPQGLTCQEKAALTRAANAAKRKVAAAAPQPGADLSESTSQAMSAGRLTRSSTRQDQDKNGRDSLNVPNVEKSGSKKRLPPTPVKESGRTKIMKLSNILKDSDAAGKGTKTVKSCPSSKKCHQPKGQADENGDGTASESVMELDSDSNGMEASKSTACNDQNSSHLAPTIDITMLDLSDGGRNGDDSDETASSVDGSEESASGTTSEADEALSGCDDDSGLHQLVKNPNALQKMLHMERATWNPNRTNATHAVNETDTNDSELSDSPLDADTTICPLYDWPESCASVSTTTSLGIDLLDLNNDAENNETVGPSTNHDTVKASHQTIQPRPLNKTVIQEKKQTQSTLREEKFKNETATWNGNGNGNGKHVRTASQKTSKTAEIKKSQTTIVKHQNNWDALTDLIHQLSKRINLKAQQPHIRDIMSKTIGILLCDIVVHDAFPEGTRGADDLEGHAAQFTKQAAAELGYDAVANRLVHDHKYRDAFTRIPRDRISGFRTKSKTALQNAFAGLGLKWFSLPIDWETVKNKRLYIFPCKDNGKPDTNKPYESLHLSTILSVLFFRGSPASNIKFDPFLLEHDGQKCVSNAMVAFAAAALYACFKVVYEPGTSLEISTSICDVYRKHFKLLHDLESQYSGHHAKLMSKLYDIVATNGQDSAIERDSDVALNDIIDTTGMAENA